MATFSQISNNYNIKQGEIFELYLSTLGVENIKDLLKMILTKNGITNMSEVVLGMNEHTYTNNEFGVDTVTVKVKIGNDISWVTIVPETINDIDLHKALKK